MKRGASIGLLFISVLLISIIAGCGNTGSSGSTSISDDGSSDSSTDESSSASNDDATDTQPTQTAQSSQETGAQPGQGAISIESVSTKITKTHEYPETSHGQEWAELTIDISGSATASALLHPGEYYGTVNVVYILYPQDYYLVTDSPYGKQYIDAHKGYSVGFQIQSPWEGGEYNRNSGDPLTIKWTAQSNAPIEKGDQIMIIVQLNYPQDFDDFFQATYGVITPFP